MFSDPDASDGYVFDMYFPLWIQHHTVYMYTEMSHLNKYHMKALCVSRKVVVFEMTLSRYRKQTIVWHAHVLYVPSGGVSIETILNNKNKIIHNDLIIDVLAVQIVIEKDGCKSCI